MTSDPGGRERADPIKHATELFGAVAGIAALVYVAGGAVYFVRLSRYGIEGLTVASGLPREFLISVGLFGLIGPWFLGLCFYLVAGFWWVAGAHSRIPGIALPVALAISGAWVALNADGRWSTTVWACIGFAALVFFALWITIIRTNELLARLVPDPRVYLKRPGTLFLRASVHGLVLVPAGLTLAAGLPLQQASVCPVPAEAGAATDPPLRGRYLGESRDRVWLAVDGPRGEARIATLPWDGVRRVYIYAPSTSAPTCPNQVASASGSPSWVPSPTHAT